MLRLPGTGLQGTGVHGRAQGAPEATQLPQAAGGEGLRADLRQHRSHLRLRGEMIRLSSEIPPPLARASRCGTWRRGTPGPAFPGLGSGWSPWFLGFPNVDLPHVSCVGLSELPWAVS